MVIFTWNLIKLICYFVAYYMFTLRITCGRMKVFFLLFTCERLRFKCVFVSMLVLNKILYERKPYVYLVDKMMMYAEIEEHRKLASIWCNGRQ